MKKQKVIYVNYSPYENMGYTLDFLINEYTNVFLFSIGHHDIGKNQRTNKITIYNKGKIKREINLYHLYTSSQFVFTFLPFRSIVNLVQILLHSYKLRKEYGQIDYYFATNGFAAWIGLWVKRLGFVKRTIYWIWDYYPISNKDKAIQAMRWLYWQFEKKTNSSDKLAFHNTRVVDVWKKHGLLPRNYKPLLIAAGTSGTTIKVKGVGKANKKNIRLCFLGVLKKSMGLDYIFDSADLLHKTFPNMVVDIIGPGPDEKYFKNRARKTKLKFRFHGYQSEKNIDRIASSCTIGIAPYMPDPSNVSYYADSAKMKRYISLDLPIIATKIHELADEVEDKRAGVMVHYGNAEELVKAIKKINSNYFLYKKNIVKLNKKFYYKDIYPKMFKFE